MCLEIRLVGTWILVGHSVDSETGGPYSNHRIKDIDTHMVWDHRLVPKEDSGSVWPILHCGNPPRIESEHYPARIINESALNNSKVILKRYKSCSHVK